jgi:hypothetical protein
MHEKCKVERKTTATFLKNLGQTPSCPKVRVRKTLGLEAFMWRRHSAKIQGEP